MKANHKAQQAEASGFSAARLGPGLLITAAFIGPGTVVTASKAGAEFGCELLWAILFACVGTIVLQSFAARLGIVSGSGLGESIRRSFAKSPWLKPLCALVIIAIGVGNAAYQTGNLTGAATGISSVAGGSAKYWVAGLACITAAIVSVGSYRIVHRVLVALVVLLSASFLFSACFGLPSVTRIADGLLVPRVTTNSLSLVIGLIGTTIVPYNLFLHASGAATTWKSVPAAQSASRGQVGHRVVRFLGWLGHRSNFADGQRSFFRPANKLDID